MSNISYYTEEGLEKLKNDVKHLQTVERPKISQQIAEARDKGDLSENAEYDAAKEAQGLLEARIAKLDDLIANGRLIDESQIDTNRVYILSKVKIRHLKLKKDFQYTIVAENEANLSAGKISIESPIGKGLVGKEVGDIADVETPTGVVKFEVLNISR
jgi:transcription elongation factor GreA